MSSEAPAERLSSSSSLLRQHECCGSCLKHDGSQRCPECGRGEGHDQDVHTGPVDGRGEGHTGPVDGRGEGHNGPADLPEMLDVQTPANGAEGSLGAAQGFPFPLCSQCGLSFDGEEHRPLLLPCGDVFCKKCLNEQEDADNQLCQLCNKSWSHSNISQLPVVLDLENGGTGATGGKGRKVPPCFPSCNSCRRKYNPSSHRPFLLLCGHCFCRSCLELRRNSGNSVCSVCQSNWASEDITKLRCVRTLVHPSNVNSEGDQSPDGNNYGSWSHDEPSNYPRTNQPGGGTEILAPKEACAVVDEDRGVFSGGSSECGWSPECEGSSEIIDQEACAVVDEDRGVFSGGSSESGRSPKYEGSSEIIDQDDGFTDLRDLSSALTAVHCDQPMDPSPVAVISKTEARPTSRSCTVNLESKHQTTTSTSAKTQQRSQPSETLFDATTARIQKGHQPAQIQPSATSARIPNYNLPAHPQPRAQTDRSPNYNQPAHPQPSAQTDISPNYYQTAHPQPSAQTDRRSNYFQTAHPQPSAQTDRRSNYFQPAHPQPSAQTDRSPNYYQTAHPQSRAQSDRSPNYYQPAHTQPSAATASSIHNRWTESNYNNGHYETTVPCVTSQHPEQSFRTAHSAPVIPRAPIKSQIFVKNTKYGTDVYQLDLKEDKVDTLMALIFEKTRFKPDRLVYGGRQLQEGRTLASYNVTPEATIYETCRLVGGGQNCRWLRSWN